MLSYAVSRSEYFGNALSKVALTIFNDTMWVKRFLMLVLDSTGSKVVNEIGLKTFSFLTTLKCNGLFSVIFSTIAKTTLLASVLKFLTLQTQFYLEVLTSSAVFRRKSKCLSFTFRYVSVIEILIFNKSTIETHLSSTSSFITSWSSTRCILSKSSQKR